ncbi:unnamed protein product [Hymenolepis diminuta]|uniref:Uncharacterized protein n=1 Tax=Hymenolepis diminuta TaxID=6216 RepID=A0A0R3SLQ3_HYMDI|nr:unnamed protein product [Hymenolepis diminuta]
MADNIIENAGSSRSGEIPHTPHPSSTKNEPTATWEERMLGLEAKIDALTTEKSTAQSPIQQKASTIQKT